MKADDFFPEEMLDSIHIEAEKVLGAIGNLDFLVGQLRETYPTYHPEATAAWKREIERAEMPFYDLADEIESLQDEADAADAAKEAQA